MRPGWWRRNLELMAAGLIAASLSFEALAFQRRRRHRRRSSAEPQHESRKLGLQAAGLRPWPQLLMLLGPAFAMGGFAALGPGVARHLGIVPRTWSGLPGVIFGCFVHLSWSHFGWNALAFLLLGLCVLRTTSALAPPDSREANGSSFGISSAMPFAAASAFIALTSGFCVWCLARPAIHAGASGVVCGYAGLLLALTLRRRDVPLGPLLMVLGVVACYGTAALLNRQLPGARAGCTGMDCIYGRSSLYEACTSRTTSAEHHTFGFLSGLASALLFCQPAAVTPCPAAKSAPRKPQKGAVESETPGIKDAASEASEAK